ncbi:protein phosphatase 2C domain-containing protein [Candidatus Pacearchaeota archaeon]|nr:protein phosphatase 2C domain-containing protein [Candidatus Pacearchaeota archaeon]
MIQTDTFLKIGDQHKVCEDYIIEGFLPVPFIILADGCSSSRDTEMGARILCHLAKQYLYYRGCDLYDPDYRKMGSWIIHNAELTVRHLGLRAECLDATLIVSYELENVVYVNIYGDGAVVTKNDVGFIQVDHVRFTNNAPYYLSYLIDELRDEMYHENKNQKTMHMTHQNGHETSYSLAYDNKTVLQYDLDRYPTIFICSDGIESFIKKDPSQREVLEPHDVLPDMMAFKTIKGEFLKRRMKRALKDLSDQGITHYDDLSIGAYTRVK